MNDRDMEQYLNNELLEKLLKDSSQQWNITELRERNLKKLFSQGEHYLSVTWQEAATVANQDGRTWLERLIIKSKPKSELAKQYVEKEGIFYKETKVYVDILSTMETKINSCDDGGEVLWPRCIGVKPYSIIILEDLIAEGFRKVDRLEGLNYECSMLTFKALAKFHVLSSTVKDKLKANEQLYNIFPFGTFSTKRYEFFKSKIDNLTEVMLSTWGPKWENLAKFLLCNSEKLFYRHVEKCQLNENNFNVLNHGDLWTSNLLFKHCEFTDNLIGIRFVDYQLTHYGSFALDLQYLLQSSVQAAVRKHHTEDLLAAYHSSLLYSARKLNLTNIVIPSLNRIKSEMTDKILVGIVLAIYLLDAMLVAPTDAVDLETLLNEGFNKFTKTVITSSAYNQRMQAILEPYIDVDLLNI